MVAACMVPVAAVAQAWPAKQVRLVIPFAPGGGADIVGRMLAARIGDATGQQVLVENRAGAGGNVGAEVVAKAPADGYTVLLTTNSIAVNASLYPKLAYSLMRDLAPVSLIANIPLVLVVHPSVPAKTVKDMVALAKARKGGLNYGSNGSGTTSHLSGVLFATEAGAAMTHVPYKGGGPVMAALLSGEVDFGFTAIITAQPYLRSGRLRAIAVTTPKPSPAAPGLPTVASVYPGFETELWHGVFLPAGTPEPVAARLHEEVLKALRSNEMRSALERDGAMPVGTTPAEFAAILVREVEKYARLVKLSGAKPE
ncbi:MAG: Bug family tripartite tricarboxylate transporter substrate binding protein [bacterium]|nr:tripartite tricarboxylate transporter substrate binding protein [Betaproteobacteria bacterium]